MAGVAREAVGDVEHRRGGASEPTALGGAHRRADVAPLAERGPGGAERAGDDEEVARTRPAAARHALRAAERSDGQEERLGPGRIAADDRHAELGEPLVEREHVLDQRVRRGPERDEQGERLCSGRGEVADVDRAGAEAELAVREPVEPEMDALDKRVLRDDEPVDERRVVGDLPGEPAPRELLDQPELTELREPHRRPS